MEPAPKELKQPDEEYVFQVLDPETFPGDLSLEELIWQDKQIMEASKQAEAGGPFVAHEDIVEWAESLATDNPLPMPEATIYTYE